MESGKDTRRELGQIGEDLACRFLMDMGHTILERNWRCGHLELDIISLDAVGIHFVEVKTRRENIQAPPQTSVNRKKQERIIQASIGFLRSGKGKPYYNYEVIFDVIAVTFSNEGHQIEWLPQAYIPLYM